MPNNQISLNEREIELCKVVDAVTRKYLSQYYEENPVYEVKWEENKEEFKWTPTLSIIPETKQPTNGINIQVHQRFKLKGVKNCIYATYNIHAPDEKTIVFAGIDVGTIVDYTIPRGYFLFDKHKRLAALPNVGEKPSAHHYNPLLSSLKLEVENQKKSRLIKMFNLLCREFVYKTMTSKYLITSWKFIISTPVGSKSWIIVHTCANSKNTTKIRVPHPKTGRSYSVKIWMPDGVMLARAIALLGEVVRYNKDYAIESEKISRIPKLWGPMTLYLTLEAFRQKMLPDDPPLYFGEVTGNINSERVKILTNEFLKLIPDSKGLIILDWKPLFLT